ncbi:MAG TPA: phosphotransferase [Polyangiaceae bacterium]|nr:phosphotransferase [Polyangiaceae bacterium]
MDAVVRGRRVLPLAEILAEEFRDRAYKDDLATLVGDRNHEEIERWVGELSDAQLGTGYSGALFAIKSVGAVFGIVLENGEPAVLKLFNRSYSHGELAAMHRCMGNAASQGYPAPRIRSELFEAAPGVWGAFYAYLDGDRRDAHEPVVRRELARSLAELSALLAPLDATDLPLTPARLETLWPPPQRIWHKLELESDDTRFIDAHATAAKSVIKKSKLPRSAAHLDWGVKNVRFRDDAVCAVYDWDSLHAAAEAECAGRAAAQFTAQWDVPALLTPTPDEAQAFLDDYQAARGKRFSRAERTVAAASARYLVAHIARLELASGIPEGDNFRGLLRDYDNAPLL